MESSSKTFSIAKMIQYVNHWVVSALLSVRTIVMDAMAGYNHPTTLQKNLAPKPKCWARFCVSFFEEDIEGTMGN